MADPIVIAPLGELDIATTRTLTPELTEATGQLDAPVIVDLTRVTFLDSTALGAIVQADGRLRRNGRRLNVVAPDGSAAAVLLELTHMRERLTVHSTLGSAREAIAAVAGHG